MEDGRSENDKMSRWIWEIVEDKTDKARIAEAEEKRTKGRKNVKREKERV